MDVGVQVGATDTHRPAKLRSLELTLLDDVVDEPLRFIFTSQATTEIYKHRALDRIPVSGLRAMAKICTRMNGRRRTEQVADPCGRYRGLVRTQCTE